MLDFFELYDTYGIPLDIIMEYSIEQGFRLDWKSFWNRSAGKGWNPYTTFSKLSMAVLDVFGDEYHKEWEFRMKVLIIKESKNGK